MALAVIDYQLRVPDSQLGFAARTANIAALELTRGTLAPDKRWHWQPDGAARLRELCATAGVAITSVSATYAYEWPHVDRRGRIDETSLASLENLGELADLAGARLLHVPCLEAGTPSTPLEQKRFVAILEPLLDTLAARGVRLALETHWPPDVMRSLWEMTSGRLMASIDTGNVIALSGDPLADFSLIGPALGQVRLRDRRRREPFRNLPLGHGDVPWNELTSLWNALTNPPELVIAATGGAATAESYASAARLLKSGLGAQPLPQVA